MMASQTKITITHDKEFTVDVQNQLIVNAMTSKMQLIRMQNFLNSIDSGNINAIVTTAIDDGNGVAASGLVTYTGIAAAGDTILISGVTLTAVASGAVSGQYNVGTTAASQAAALAAGILLSTSLVGIVTATATGAVVTVSAAVPGTIGNAVTLAKGVDAGSVATVSGVTGGKLQNGAAPTSATSVTYRFGL
jgi:phage tail sheath gpL-like